MMRIMTTIFLIALILQQLLGQNTEKIRPEPRYQSQSYFEDSINVYWTSFPNPMSTPYLRDSSKVSLCGIWSFHCEISDTVTVALLGEKDSVIYETTGHTLNPPHFGFCFWLAGPRFDPKFLPDHFIVGSVWRFSNIALIVNGRKKCMRSIHIDISGASPLYGWIANYGKKKLN